MVKAEAEHLQGFAVELAWLTHGPELEVAGDGANMRQEQLLLGKAR